MIRCIFIAGLLLLIITACSNSSNKEEYKSYENAPDETTGMRKDSNVIKVYVDAEGIITADGERKSIAALDSAFEKLKAIGGAVYYSRPLQGDPPAEAMQVMDLVGKHSLSLQFYTDKTFTTVWTPE